MHRRTGILPWATRPFRRPCETDYKSPTGVHNSATDRKPFGQSKKTVPAGNFDEGQPYADAAPKPEPEPDLQEKEERRSLKIVANTLRLPSLVRQLLDRKHHRSNIRTHNRPNVPNKGGCGRPTATPTPNKTSSPCAKEKEKL